MTKKKNRKDPKPELVEAEKQIEAIKGEIAQAMIVRNSLPKSATDEEKAAAVARVEQLQARHHEAVQRALAIKRDETARLEREHKEKKLRHKRLAALRQPAAHAEPHEEQSAMQRRASIGPALDRDAEEAQMDAANEEDVLLERRLLEEAEELESAEELAHQRALAEKKRKKEAAAVTRESRRRQKQQAQERAEVERLKAEKQERAKMRQQAALQRAEEAKAKKRQQAQAREARRRAEQVDRSPRWFSEVLRIVTRLFKRYR
ncbi:MAG: hypothetical protein ACE5E5_06835 [Phycisphaerae bacterium]